MVSRLSLIFAWMFLACLCVLAGCRNDLKTKGKVEEAIVKRLREHSGLDLNSMDLNTTSVSFEKNKAFATVSFHPKGDPTVNSGMTMRYTLEERDGGWTVVQIGDSGHGTSSMTPRSSSGELPAGHPPLSEGPAKPQ